MGVFSLPPFKNEALWQQAMTHSSFINEQLNEHVNKQQEVREHNERLEFLGDAILNFISGSYLYDRYPTRPEGELSAIRSALVDQPQLCHFAQALSLGSYLKLGKGASKSGSRHSARLLCSAFEAMVGAYFLDSDHDVTAVRRYVTPMFDAVIDDVVAEDVKDDKTRLQEEVQKATGAAPSYVDVGSSGPDHAKQFVVEVQIGGKAYATGKGSSKQKAQKAAARETLKMIQSAPIDPSE